LQRNKTSLHIVTSVGYSIEYYDARNNKYQVQDNRLWKIQKISDTLNNKFCETYNPTEHLAVVEVIMLYKEE